MTETVQVADGATLTIAPGTTISGNGHNIQLQGDISAVGRANRPILFDDVNISGVANYDQHTTALFTNVEFHAGTFFAPTGNSYSATVTVDRAFFNGVTYYQYYWYQTDSSIRTSVFLDSGRVSVGTRSSFTFENNVVARQTPIYDHTEALEVWAAYGGALNSRGNAFLSDDRLAIRVTDALISTADYFAGGDPDALILDGNDDVQRPVVTLVDPAAAPGDHLPTALIAYTSLTLPDSLLRDVKLIGTLASSVTGNRLDNRLTGNNADNALHGERGDDRLVGADGNNTLTGGHGADTLVGGRGNDSLDGGRGEDNLLGFEGNDILLGRDENDRLDGGDGDDLLFGGASRSRPDADDGNDRLAGGTGNDTLVGGTGDDALVGGDGADVFRIQGAFGRDVVQDWEDGLDMIGLVGLDLDDLTITSRGQNAIVALTEAPDHRLVILGGAGLIDAGDFVF